MKRSKIIASLLLLFLGIWSCDNEPYEGELYFPETNDIPTIPIDFENTFYAELNGEEFKDQNIYSIVSEGPEDSDFIAITGSENNYHSIILYLPLNIAVGTYYYSPETIVNIPNLNVTYSNLADLLLSGIGNGSITITEHNQNNQRISGNFECHVNSSDGSIQYITAGRFDVLY